MKAKATLFVVFLITIAFGVISACTANQRAKKFGGTASVELPPGTKLITATWKEEQIWYLYSERQPGEIPVKSTFHEQSKFGLVEGKVIFTEK